MIRQFIFLKSERYRNRLLIELLQLADKCGKALPLIVLVGAEDAGEALPAVEGDPGELPAVVV